MLMKNSFSSDWKNKEDEWERKIASVVLRKELKKALLYTNNAH